MQLEGDLRYDTDHDEWRQRLRNRKILMRWFDLPGVSDYLRITVGTEAEAKALVRAAREMVRG